MFQIKHKKFHVLNQRKIRDQRTIIEIRSMGSDTLGKKHDNTCLTSYRNCKKPKTRNNQFSLPISNILDEIKGPQSYFYVYLSDFY